MEKLVKTLKKIKIRNILILVILLVFNTYAWFIYTTKVSLDLTAHVSAWNVEFVGKDGGVTTESTIDVERIYPGMDDFEHIIEVKNRGEVNVGLEYEINSVKIMDQLYEVTEDGTLTSQELEDKIKNDYPFKIKIEKDDAELEQGQGNGNFRITVTWPYESGDDTTDTKWGEKAYRYYSVNPDEKCIQIKLTLKAVQKN